MNCSFVNASALRCLAGACLCAAVLNWFVPPATGADVDFYRDVYPILKVSCISCHNKTTTKSGLNLETPELIRQGGDAGPGLVPGKSAESLVFQAATRTGDYVMPPKDNKAGAPDLTATELAVLAAWIDQGAKSSVKQTQQVTWQPLPPGVHPIYAVAMTRDGRFAACGRANQLDVYDLATRRFAARLIDDTLRNRDDPHNTGSAHRGMVYALDFSPDGTRLASGSYREVKIWRRDAPRTSKRTGDPAVGAVAAVLSADGKQLICADKQGALHVLDAGSGASLKTIPAVAPAGLSLLCIAPDSTQVAVCTADDSIGIWSLAEGKNVSTFPGVKGTRSLAWTSDGHALVAGGDDQTLRVWTLPVANPAEPGSPKELKAATGAIMALIAAHNPDRFLAASAEGKVRLWSISESKVIRELNIAGVVSLAVSPDDNRLAAGCQDGAVRVWDIQAGKQTAELRGSVETARRLAGLDWQIASLQLDLSFQKSEVSRWEAQAKTLEELLKKANETITGEQKLLPDRQASLKKAQDAKAAAQAELDAVAAKIAGAPDNKPDPALVAQKTEVEKKLMAATMEQEKALAAVTEVENHIKDAQAEVTIVTAAKEQNSAKIPVATAAVTAAQQVLDKTTADVAAAKAALAQDKLKPLALSFSTDAQSLAAVFDNGECRVWALASSMPIDFVPGGTSASAACLIAPQEGAFLACLADGSTTGVSTAAPWVVERVLGGETTDSPFADRVNGVRFSPDGKSIAAGSGEPSRSGDVSVWDVGTGKLLHDWRERHSDAVLSVDFSPDGNFVASGGADKAARVTSLASGEQVKLFEGHTHHVMGVTFRADGRVVATAGADGLVLTWDMASGERLKKVEGWQKEVTALQFIGATNQIVTSAGDNLIRIIRDDGGQVRSIANLPDFMQSTASNATGSLVIGGGEDGVLRAWDGTNGQELAQFAEK